MTKHAPKTTNNQNSRKITVGNTTYILTSNFVPNRQNKAALIKIIKHIMENRAKPVK